MSQKESSRPTTIYALIDPMDSRVRYVGKTCMDMDVRLRNHISDGKRMITWCNRWVNSLTVRGLTPKVSVLMTVDGDSWPAWERMFIKWFRDICPKLTNISDGGEGNPRGGMVSVSCNRCGVGFLRKKSMLKSRNGQSGRVYCSRSCASKDKSDRGLLTGRKRVHDHLIPKIVLLRDRGRTYREIGDELNISPQDAHRLFHDSVAHEGG